MTDHKCKCSVGMTDCLASLTQLARIASTGDETRQTIPSMLPFVSDSASSIACSVCHFTSHFHERWDAMSSGYWLCHRCILFRLYSLLFYFQSNQRRSDMLTDVHGTSYHICRYDCTINVATALEVCFCTCPVKLTRACRSTVLGLHIVEKGLYRSCVSVELRSDNFAARAG